MNQCPLCERTDIEATSEDPLDRIWKIQCPTCGNFEITEKAIGALGRHPYFRNQRAKVSAYVRERKIMRLPMVMLILEEESEDSDGSKIRLVEVISRFPERVMDRLDRALTNLYRLSRYSGDCLKIYPKSDYPVLYADSIMVESAMFMIHSLRDMGFVKEERLLQHYELVITPSGWHHIYEIEKGSNKGSSQSFVAMWFNEEMDSAWENGFSKGIIDAGYTPVRIDNVEHNNKICDEIIAEIRKSRFIVCDFTGQRGGVYFEAGFGLGLGIPVIWTCREDHSDQLHFDTRQYSHIIWKDENDLREKLRNRILATVSL